MPILFVLLMLMSACSSSQVKNAGVANNTAVDSNEVLIVYLSRTNNTKAVAEMIHERVGGTLLALEVETLYPEDYKTTVKQVAEENESGYLPPLKTKVDGIEKYDVVFVGFPTWGMQLPPPMKSFLSGYDLSGKTIVPFNTHAGYGAGSSFQTVKSLCSNSTVLEGYSTKGGEERDGIYFVMQGEKETQTQVEINKWLETIGILK